MSYKIVLPSEHRKVRDDQRAMVSHEHGKKTKYRVAFVARRNKKNGKLFHIAIDPRTFLGGHTSPEVYALTKEAVADLEQFRRSTALNILTSPQNKVDFRWVSRDTVREIRKMARDGRATVLTR